MITAVVGQFAFMTGLLILQFNPFWRSEPGLPGTLDHRVYAWNGIGHFISALGLFFTLGALIYLISRLFSTKSLSWTAVAIATAVLLGTFGRTGEYSIHYHWAARTGVTEFTVFGSAQKPKNLVWQRIVRWQVEPELEGWLSSSTLRCTHGVILIKVVGIVPIALPTLDCDCFECCLERNQ